MELTDYYSTAPGVFTFRGGLKRQADFGGTVSGTPSQIIVDWTFHTQEDYSQTSVGSWGGGTGWTGQPLYVEWPDSCLAKMKSSGVVESDFSGKEIMVGSLFGSVYFIDFNTGKASRKAIPVGNPIKGTISLDPTLNGNLYVGQGVPGKRPFGALAIDLYKNEQFHFFAEDPKAQRRWGAYDSSPLRIGQFLFRPGENGGFYKLTAKPGELAMHSVLRYTVGGSAPGIESSMAAYSNYGFIADNHGNILGVNLDNMKPVWLYQLGDDIDATPVIAVEDGTPYLYVGCEIDLQDAGSAKFVKLNALNGEEVWLSQIEGRRHNIEKKHFDGGFYASAVLGEGNCENLLFTNCVKNTKGQNGCLVALDRTTGKIVYETPLKYYAWSSPVKFVNESGQMFIVTGDCTGNLYIINAADGKILATQHVGNNFESSPVIIGNQLVVGSRGNSIFKVSIK
ncbi:MAG: PQQ-binding-like beta-propeller repeat protein [Firmicutes bacterium]|nr:PQQ-binding-like beta-propeller repeat protein [Bacillota bacterium]MCM1401111.1 PQQ-binding-like beta-propeller repeat protein [Bacteroides sp.]MCM1477066.1 PQQ-binding-like beta-propeller repeat protein [Bacteroides sp.]